MSPHNRKGLPIHQKVKAELYLNYKKKKSKNAGYTKLPYRN